MKIVLSPDELRRACAEYISAKHPAMRGKSVQVTFEEVPLTPDEARAVNCGLRVTRTDWVQAVAEVSP